MSIPLTRPAWPAPPLPIRSLIGPSSLKPPSYTAVGSTARTAVANDAHRQDLKAENRMLNDCQGFLRHDTARLILLVLLDGTYLGQRLDATACQDLFYLQRVPASRCMRDIQQALSRHQIPTASRRTPSRANGDSCCQRSVIGAGHFLCWGKAGQNTNPDSAVGSRSQARIVWRDKHEGCWSDSKQNLANQNDLPHRAH